MKIESIPSELPEWYDPQAPNFVKPSSWIECRVRISVPVSVNPSQELAEARTKLQKRYPGADLYLIPEFTKTTQTTQSIDINGSDEDLLRSYFSTVTLPVHVSVDQIVSYISKFIPSISVFGSKGLKFISVVADNVLCFEHCEIDLNQKGLTLVTGLSKDWPNRSNGVGKSSWVSLAFIALFGKTFKDQTHDEWASEFNEDTAKLILDLILNDDRELKIIRCRRPQSLRVYVDGSEVTMGSPSATQNLIEHLTNLTWEVLTNALYIGQSEIGSVFGTEKERKELFSRLLGLERFLDAQSKLSKVSLKIRRSIETIDLEIDSTDARIHENIDAISNLLEELNDVPKVSKKEIKSFDTNLKVVKSKIASLEVDLYNFIQSREACVLDLQKLISKISESQTRIKSFQKTLDLSRVAKERCHVCGNKVDIKIIKTFQNDLIQSLESEKKSLAGLSSEDSLLSAKISTLRSKERSVNTEISSLCSSKDSLENDIASLTSHCTDCDRLTKTISEKQSRIKVLEKTKLIHQQAKQATLEEKQFVDICVNAVSRNGLPAYLCETITPQLNITAQHYSDVFAEGEIGIEFAASNGDVDIHVRNLHGGKLTKSQSEGEMRMSAIITAFTFRDVLLQLNLLIVDEPSEGFDSENSQAFAKGLSRVVDRFQHVMIISHNTNLLGSLEPDRRVEIVKENGRSTASIVSV